MSVGTVHKGGGGGGGGRYDQEISEEACGRMAINRSLILLDYLSCFV